MLIYLIFCFIHRDFGSDVIMEVKIKFDDGISRKFSGKVLLEEGLIMIID